MVFPTNANQVQAFANALYGTPIGAVTMVQVNKDIVFAGGLNKALNGYYKASFGNVATATVAATVAANLGLTGDAWNQGVAYITTRLNAADPNARGAVVADILNLLSSLASDATFGAVATEWNTRLEAAVTSYINEVVEIAETAAATAAAAAAAAAAADAGSAPAVSSAMVFSLSDGVDTGVAFTAGAADNTFNAELSAEGANTLDDLDRLDGGAGTDTLNVALASDVTPASITNIEAIVVTGSGGARTLGLANATGVTSVTASGSAGGVLTVTGIAAGAALAVQSQAVGADFQYASTTGAQSATLSVSAVTEGAPITVNGIETIAVTATGAASTYQLAADAVTSLSFAGSSNQTITLADMTAVSHFNASAATGNVNLTVINQSGLLAATPLTVSGGAGNDTLLVSAHTQSDMSVHGGAGDDTVVAHANLSSGDVVNGGEGNDTLAIGVAATAASAPGVSNVEFLRADSALTQDMAQFTNNAGFTRLVSNVAGSVTFNNVAATTNELRAISTGTAPGTNTLTFDRLVDTPSNALTIGAFTDANTTIQSLVANDEETINIVAGGASTAGRALTIFNMTAADLVTLNVSGASHFITSIGPTSTNLATVDASTHTGTVGINAFFVNSAVSITGSATAANVLVGGWGSDVISGGSAADRLFGGDGDDTLSGGSGADTIDGGAGIDTLVIDGAATAASGPGVSNVEFLRVDTALTQDMSQFTNNAGFTRLVSNVAGNVTFNNVAATTNELRAISSGTAPGTNTLTFDRLVDTASDALTIGAFKDANTDIATLEANDEETIHIVAGGASTAGRALTIINMTAADLVTLNVSGATRFFTSIGATSPNLATVDASTHTGTVAINAFFATSDMTIKGSATAANVLFSGSGADVITGGSAADQLLGGDGDDTLSGGSDADTIDGGEGTDTLSTTNAQANVLDAETPSTYTITNIETLSISDALEDGVELQTQNIATSINKVVLANAEADTALLGANAWVVGSTGAFTLDLGSANPDNTARVLGAELTVTNTGTATNDSVAIFNKSTDSTTGLALDVFDGQYIISTGYESVSIHTGAVFGGARQDIGTLTITPDSTSADVTLTLAGANNIDIFDSFTTSSTGLLTIDASGLAAHATGTVTFELATTNQGDGGTTRITGSEGDDSIVVGNFASTIVGGAGNDTLTGGTAADNLQGGDGSDTLLDGGGQDTLTGGAGNDTITIAGTLVTVDAGEGDDTVMAHVGLNSDDVVDGGAGNDTLVLDLIATEASAPGVSQFEFLRVDTALTQDMAQFTSSAGFTRLISNVADSVTFNNVAATTNELLAISTGANTLTFDRLVDTPSDALTFGAYTDANTTIATLVANDEETIQIVDGGATTVGRTFTITTLTAADLVTLNVSGASHFSTTIDASATALATVDASTNTGTVNISATDATSALTMTGSTTAASTLTGGSGADVITGGSAADSLRGGDNDDTLSGGAGADTIDGGTGNDSLTGGAGNDTITIAGTSVNVDAGEGDDTVTKQVGLSSDDVVIGGAGDDTLVLKGAATEASAPGVSQFEFLRVDTALTQDMAQFTNNAGFTRLVSNVAGSVTFNNVAATTNELRAISTGTAPGTNTLTFDRLVDTPSDALTFGAYTDANTTIATLVANDEEAIQIVDGGATTAGRTFTITTLTAADLVTLNVSGASNFNITIDATATALTTVDASANTGTSTIIAFTVTSALTMTGSATAKSVLNGGKGADLITAGNVGSHLAGQDNDDTLIGGSGADTMSGGNGNDSLRGGEGVDIFRGGAGNDTLDLSETIAARDLVWLEATVAGTGTDTVLGFTAGAGGDVFRVFHLMNMNATALNAKRTANPGVSTNVDGDVNLLVDIADGEDITTADGLTAALAVGGEYANIDITNNNNAMFVTAANSEPGTQYVFYATAAAGVITASLVGTISNVDIDDFVLSNFNP